MKKQILTLIFTIVVFILQGQTIQYLENNPIWRYNKAESIMPPDYVRITGEYNYFLSGDTIINGKTYKKLYSKGYIQSSGSQSNHTPPSIYSYVDNKPKAFLRQEDRKIFYISKDCIYWNNNELLLYNFDLKPNDTLKFYYECDNDIYFRFNVDSIDSIKIDSFYRKVLYISGTDCEVQVAPEKIIEGIGGEFDLFLFCMGEDVSSRLKCFGLNGQTIYSTSDNCELEIDIGIKEECSNKNYISIFPNPASEEAVVSWQSAESSKVKLSVYDIVGKLVYSLHSPNPSQEGNLKINTSNLNKGLYFVKIETDSGSGVVKFIKE